MGWCCWRCIRLRVLGPSCDEPRNYGRCRTRRHRQYCTNARFRTQRRPARQMDRRSSSSAPKQRLVAAHNLGRQRCRIALQFDLQWLQFRQLARRFSNAILPLFACRATATPLGSDTVSLWRVPRVKFGAWTIPQPVQSESTEYRTHTSYA